MTDDATQDPGPAPATLETVTPSRGVAAGSVEASVPAAGPLRIVAWGLLVALVDVRLGWFDLLPDVVGWWLVALGTGRLLADRPGDLAGLTVRVGAVTAGALSVGDTLVRAVAEGTRGDAVSLLFGAGGLALGTAMFSMAAVAEAITVFTLIGIVLRRASGGDDESERRWWWLRFGYGWTALPALVVTGVMNLGLADGGGGFVLSIIFTVGSLVALAVLVLRSFRDARRPWALAFPG